MRPSIQLLFLLLFVFQVKTYGQDSTSQIKDKWGIVKTLLQKRCDIISNLTKTLSKSKVSKTQNNNLKTLAIDFYNYVDSLGLTDSVSISIAAAKNKKLWQSLIVTLIEIEKHQEIMNTEKFAILQGNLEGCENSIQKATRDYNEICSMYNRKDLLFLLYYQNR